MPPKTVKSNLDIGEAIKNRRNELNLTLAEAASKAGIGIKTWSRYESGESIRKDKVSGLCRTLKWKALPETESDESNSEFIKECRKSKVWSPFLQEHFGELVALSFVIGSDLLLDQLNEDLSALSEMPRGTHIGEVPASVLSSSLPQQFLMRYDYEFMWNMRKTLKRYRENAPHTEKIIAHSVLDELVLYLVMEESRFLMEEIELDYDSEDNDESYIYWKDWAFDIFDDMDIVTFLYSDIFILTSDDTYHFDNWFTQQFYIDRTKEN